MAVLPLSGCVHFIARPASYLRGEKHHATAADALNFRVAVRLQGGRGSNDAKASLLSAADAKEQRFGGRGGTRTNRISCSYCLSFLRPITALYSPLANRVRTSIFTGQFVGR